MHQSVNSCSTVVLLLNVSPYCVRTLTEGSALGSWVTSKLCRLELMILSNCAIQIHLCHAQYITSILCKSSTWGLI